MPFAGPTLRMCSVGGFLHGRTLVPPVSITRNSVCFSVLPQRSVGFMGLIKDAAFTLIRNHKVPQMHCPTNVILQLLKILHDHG